MYPDVGGVQRQSFFAYLVALSVPDAEDRRGEARKLDGNGRRRRGRHRETYQAPFEVPTKAGVVGFLLAELQGRRAIAAFLAFVEDNAWKERGFSHGERPFLS